MIFKELELNNFGKFEKHTFSFNPGFNIIAGKNEAGKSTLFQAFLGTLFGFKSDRDKYFSWNSPQSCKAHLKIEALHSSIFIERDFVEDMVKMTQKTTPQDQVSFSYHGKVSPQGRSSEREIYLNKIQELFGFCDPDIFKHSLFIEQRSLSMPPQGQTASELKQLISHVAEFRYDSLINQLEERYFQITKKNPKGIDKRNDRLLEETQKMKADLEERVRRAHQGQESLQKLAEKINQEKETLQTKERRFKLLTKSLESLESLSKFVKKENELKETVQDLQKKKNLIERLAQELEALDKNKPLNDRLLFGVALIALLSLPFLVFTTSLHVFWIFSVYILLGIFFIRHFYQQKTKLESFRMQKVRLTSQLEVLPDSKQATLLLDQKKALLFELEQQKKEFEKHVIDPEKPISRAMADQHIEKEALDYQIQKLKETLSLEKQNYIFLSKGLESPFTLEEDLYDVKQKEKDLKIKAQALWMAKELLSQIVIDFRKEHLKLFANDIEKTFQTLSQEDYQELILDQETLSASLQWKHLPISLSSLSCGTIDQLYFSMKISLLRILGSDRNLPIFLDDPFVNFDHSRRIKSLELLKSYSQKHQIFLFTYDPWYLENIKDANVIKL